MKAANFAYTRVLELDEALQALAGTDGSSKTMGGGQSLGPMLNLRLARPARVVDIGSVESLRTVRVAADGIEIGAGVTHADVEDGVHEPLVGHPMQGVASGIAYRAIRTRGTVAGSLAHADPAADWVVVLAALGASVRLRSTRGERTLAVEDFMRGAYTTLLEPDELIVSVTVPRATPTTRWGYHKLCRKPGEFAEASAAVYIDESRSAGRIALGAVDGSPILLTELGDAVLERRADAADRAQLRAAVALALPERDAIDHKLFTACLERALDHAGLTGRAEARGAPT